MNYLGEVIDDQVQDTQDPPNTWVTAYKYDSNGRVTSKTNPSGLTATIDYYETTTAIGSNAGGVAGYFKDYSLQNGTSGTPVKQEKVDYVEEASRGATFYRIADDTAYKNDDGSGAQTTSYTYVYGLKLMTMQITQPATSDSPSTGSGQATDPATTTIDYDYAGRPQWTQDPDGNISFTGYNEATDAVNETITDATHGFTDVYGIPQSIPSAMRISENAELNLTTKTTVDDLGRPLTATDAMGNVTNYSYPSDSNTASETKVIITPPTGPKQVIDDNLAQGWEDVYSLDRTQSDPTVSTPLSLTRTYFDNAGRAVRVDKYFKRDGLSYDPNGPTGFLNINYYETTYQYNSIGLLSTTIDPLGTNTTTDYNDLGEAIDKKIGGTVVETYQYDGGQVGDGNLTQVTDIPGPDSQGNALPEHVTTNYYDWRDRLVASDNGVRITFDTLDNLGEVGQEDVYSTADANFPSFADPTGFANGNPAPPASAAALRARTQTFYDERGRVQDVMQYAVDPNNGNVSGDLISNNAVTYDADGNVIASSSTGGLWTKTTYDGAGRPKVVYYTDNAGGDVTSVSCDHVFTQVEYTYNKNGDTTQTAATDNSFGDTGVSSRLSTIKNYYDSADRLTVSDNLGTSSVASGNALETKYSYDSNGNVQNTTDPAGIVTNQQYDMLDRVTIETDDAKSGGSTPDTNKVTTYQYNGDNEPTLVEVQDVIPGQTGLPQRQDTQYAYGGTNSLDKSELSSVTYPGGSNETYVYDHLGEPVVKVDRAGNRHLYRYDSLGRLLSDFVSSFGAGVDTTTQILATAYDVLDRPVLYTSEGAGGAVLNQVTETYNAFGQLLTETQDHGSPTTAQTISYGYTSAGTSSRLTSVTYPDQHVVQYGYSGSAMDDSISRVDSVSDGASAASVSVDEQYGYLGLQTILQRTRPAAGQPSLDVQLDSFGRVQTWKWQSGSTLIDGYGYQYNNDDTVNGIDNLKWGVHTTLGYDNLERMTSDSRGTITYQSNGQAGSNSALVTPASWTVDSLGTRYGAPYGTSYAPGGQPALGYSSGGNAVSFNYSTSNTSSFKFDAWNRLVQITSSQTQRSSGSWTFVYDPLGRRIRSTNVNQSTGATVTTVEDDYYDGQNLIQDGTNDFVWSPDGHLIKRGNDYALDDAEGSITAAISSTGGVSQRFVYDKNGSPTALDANFNTFTTTSPNDPGTVQRNWQFLYHQERWLPLFSSSMIANNWRGGGGVYMDVQGNWTNSINGTFLAPNPTVAPSQTPYQYVPYDRQNIGFWGQLWEEGAPAIAATIKVGSWLNPVVGFAVNWAGTSYERSMDGQGLRQSVFGGLGDVTGISGVWNGLEHGSISEVGLGMLQMFAVGASFARPLMALSRIAGPILSDAGQAFRITASGRFINFFRPPPAMALADGGAALGVIGGEGAAGMFGGCGGPGWGLAGGFGNAMFSLGLSTPSSTFTHSQYVQWVLGRDIPKEVPFNTDGGQRAGLGSRRYDAFDPVTGTGFEGNTQPWAEITPDKLQFKLKQIGADIALLAEGQQGLNSIRRVIWFGTESLPTTGPAAQIRIALEEAGISYYVVKP